MRYFKGVSITPAYAAEELIQRLKKKYPNRLEIKIVPQVFEEEDIGVDIYAPEEIVRDVSYEAHTISHEIMQETGIWVLPFVHTLRYGDEGDVSEGQAP